MTTSGAASTDRILLHVGELVLVRADESFTLLRIYQTHPTNRTSPRSLVFGHLLEETPDELYVYDNRSHDETKVCNCFSPMAFKTALKCSEHSVLSELVSHGLPVLVHVSTYI